MPAGGPRPGSGRPRGSKNASTLQREEMARRAAAGGITPLEVMLERMRELWAGGQKDEAVEIAKYAAPYVHPRLSAVQAEPPKFAPVAVKEMARLRPLSEILIGQ